MAKKYVYNFGKGAAEGNSEMKDLLGGKGANLAEMTNLKLPVPAGFTITTEVCTYYYNNKLRYPKELKTQVKNAISLIESQMGATFGSNTNPLLLSVRSGARASMPGMMDTILNLGLNKNTVNAMINKTSNDRFVYDSYRRFIQMYGDVVLNLKPADKSGVDPFEELLEKKKRSLGIILDVEFTANDLMELCDDFKQIIRDHTGHRFPEDPEEQLWGAIGAVFNSWMNERAIVYRSLNRIPDDWGTAVNVQSMVFGNMGETSGTGVAFTRDPASGENKFYGEYLMNAQGEDVVAGTRTPHPISDLKKTNKKIYNQLESIRLKLEKHYKDMMDIEFTIQEGNLYMLQCRIGKRTGLAALKMAVDMVNEKLISKTDALMRVQPEQLNQLLRPVFDLKEKSAAIKSGNLLAKGLNAGPGAASGRVYFNSYDAVNASARGEEVILVRIETSPEDIRGMNISEGILTSRGGMTSHAALVARQMGKVCVAGCGKLEIDYLLKHIKIEDKPGIIIREGDFISIDGSTGEVLNGKLKTKPSEILQVLIDNSLKPNQSNEYKYFSRFLKWADEVRHLSIRTNADQPDQSKNAVAFGAEGIGLCRTEHMFFGGNRIDAVREMILAYQREGRVKALKKLLPYQRKDFMEIFRVMKGLPVNIRLLDPPLHEFLPKTEIEIKRLAELIGTTIDEIKYKIDSLHEFNPMLGHRGCRLAITYPEITEMQVSAIIEAAIEVQKEKIKPKVEIMIPLIATLEEFVVQEELIRRTAEKIISSKKTKVDYTVGTMIEVPRASLQAGKIAKRADFFSFGTNDLTQLTFGISRDDSAQFILEYLDKGIIERDPFETIDRAGVGELMKIATERGRKTNRKLKIGICGEHGGEPDSIDFCNSIGLNYVSCSPFRVPIARLAAAQAVLKK
ncbi:pyruvate, phosphate dikinase [Ignavibacteria bacterium CHB1]|mgnify:CR=1 FL=1|nr:MAG: pyruvate, phosphate dikinase [Chlorobiota bacterium]MBV6398122.1 Pyruvate, phosphate dikinase [Ignavibacteria bacterium]MCC6886571.1 pyruvate, phosphate dikinase [Ignavibacteriales bacterium]MCE7952354.1 pyruvate, phosphate dikinase [Chlorobi bacterium CHB7]MDL1886471.1 pyruvate, phosphate dikinase [Ignavibacteria bacterium CHB1]RIK48066.1 MAG: pyruvate, phosphate dikinase [Ignavibacteriota bacterium]